MAVTSAHSLTSHSRSTVTAIDSLQGMDTAPVKTIAPSTSNTYIESRDGWDPGWPQHHHRHCTLTEAPVKPTPLSPECTRHCSYLRAQYMATTTNKTHTQQCTHHDHPHHEILVPITVVHQKNSKVHSALQSQQGKSRKITLDNAFDFLVQCNGLHIIKPG